MRNHSKKFEPTNVAHSAKPKSYKKIILTITLSVVMLSSLFQLNAFAITDNSSISATSASASTPPSTTSAPSSSASTPTASTSESTVSQPATSPPASTSTENGLSAAAGVQPSPQSQYALVNPAAAGEQYRITYHSNYPAASGLSNGTYLDPVLYENEMLGTAATLTQTGFSAPENYYLLGWSPAANAGTADYAENEVLSKIDQNWDLYAIWMPYRTMVWTIQDSEYSSAYNAQSHTSLITWPTVVSSAWAGEVINGLTYQYSVNGGAFSTTKPEFIDAGNYTVTIKASAPRYAETTATVTVSISKAPLTVSPDVLASYTYGSLSSVPYMLPAVNAENGPKSQADEIAINNVLAATNPLFDAIDSSNNAVANLSTALPGPYTVSINSSALANLQTNVALRNYNLTAAGGSFNITVLSGLTVSAQALNTTYNAQYHDAVHTVTSSLTNATLEYSIDGGAFTTTIPTVKDASSYSITIRASAPGHNDATITLTAVVAKRNVTLDIANYSKVFGTDDPTFTASFSGLQASDTIAYTLSRIPGETVGDYVIGASVAINNNYNVTVNNGLLTITAAPATPVAPVVPEPPTDIGTTPDTVTTIAPAITTPQNNNDTEAAEADTPQVNIFNERVPLASPNGVWSLLNLMLAIATILLSVALVIGYFIGKNKDEDGQKLNRKAHARFGSIIVALVSVLAFLLTQDIRLDMVFIDQWSIAMLLIATVQIIVSIVARKTVKKQTSSK